MMDTPTYITTGQIADMFGIADWQVRRVVDALGKEIPRAGLYRLVPRSLLASVATELERRGWMRQTEEVTTS
jgi:hypothetical protein